MTTTTSTVTTSMEQDKVAIYINGRLFGKVRDGNTLVERIDRRLASKGYFRNSSWNFIPGGYLKVMSFTVVSEA
jgi:hypothetical protein